MGRKTSSTNARAAQLQQRWATNVGPFMVAAREGALRANRTARKEWTKAHRAQRRWYRRRWLAVLAGLLLAGAAAGGAAATLLRRREDDFDLDAVREQARAGMQAGLEKGRDTVSAAREAADHFRGEAPAGPTG